MSRWLAALSVAALSALVFGAAPTLAATQPELQVVPFKTTPGAVADTELDLTLADSGAPTAKVTLYVPSGYSANLNQAVGTTLGTVDVTASAGGSQLKLSGQIVTDDPTKYAADPRAQACAAGTHAAVWVIKVGTIAVPMYVDPTPAAQSTLGAYSVQVCLASPEIPEAAGGAPNGLRLLEADLDWTATFTNPATPAIATWRALVTPYVSGTGTPNPAGTVEVRSIAFIPFTISIKGHYDKKTHKVIITGAVRLVTAKPTGLTVVIFGTTKNDSATLKPFSIVKTKKGGTYSLKKKITKAMYFTPFIPQGSEACTEPPVSAAPCVGETTAPAFGPVIHVKIKK